jgi:ABC-2 type transport system ATP-binding protein
MSVIVEQLTKIYGKQKAVNDVSFEVKSGEIVGFLGPNGAGKSTTMKIATGYIPPSSGRIEVCGYDVIKNSMAVRRNIGYLPEHNPLYLDMYVKEYLRFIGSMHQIKGRKLTQRVEEIISLCGLEIEQSKKIAQLSKGYRQRVGLAQALIHNPPVLILDEPTTGLDPNQIVEIRNLIKSIGKEKTVIFSTHIMQEVQAICDRAVIINLGKIVANSSVQELKNLQKSELNTFLLEFEQPVPIEQLEEIEGIERWEKLSELKYRIFASSDKEIRGEIFKFAGEKNWMLLGLQQEESSLESIFQQLTKGQNK